MIGGEKRERGSRTGEPSERKKEKSRVNLLRFSLFFFDRALLLSEKKAQTRQEETISSPTREEGTLVTREVVRCGSDADDADEGTWSDAADAADGIVEVDAAAAAASEPVLEGFCSFPALPVLCCEEVVAAAASSLPPPASDILEATARKKKTRERERKETAK